MNFRKVKLAENEVIVGVRTRVFTEEIRGDNDNFSNRYYLDGISFVIAYRWKENAVMKLAKRRREVSQRR